jgi:hypothetical protein
MCNWDRRDKKGMLGFTEKQLENQYYEFRDENWIIMIMIIIIITNIFTVTWSGPVSSPMKSLHFNSLPIKVWIPFFVFLRTSFAKVMYRRWSIDEWVRIIGGMKPIGRKWSSQSKICPSAASSTTNPTWNVLGLNSGLCSNRPATIT